VFPLIVKWRLAPTPVKPGFSAPKRVI